MSKVAEFIEDIRAVDSKAATTDVTTALEGKEPTITTLPVSKGGTGASTLTGLVKGNGTGAMTAAVAGVDYITPSELPTYSIFNLYYGN